MYDVDPLPPPPMRNSSKNKREFTYQDFLRDKITERNTINKLVSPANGQAMLLFVLFIVVLGLIAFGKF